MKILTVSALVCALMALTTADGKSHVVKRSTYCPNGWAAFNGRCFLYVPTLKTWADAENSCQSHGGNLASVHSFDESHSIQSMILRITGRYPLAWLGGSDAQQEGTWFWSDGSAFRYSYWAPGQPDNRGSADCLLMNFGDHKRFDDQPCHFTMPFVCAKKP